MLVVDASVIVVALGDAGPSGQSARSRLRGESLAAPELMDLEVISAWRRLSGCRKQTAAAIAALKQLRVARAPHLALLDRCWDLRDNLTTYDAAYVALAEQLDAVLLTADEKLAGAPRLRFEIELIS